MASNCLLESYAERVCTLSACDTLVGPANHDVAVVPILLSRPPITYTMPLGYFAGGSLYTLVPQPLPATPLHALGSTRHRMPTYTMSLRHLENLHTLLHLRRFPPIASLRALAPCSGRMSPWTSLPHALKILRRRLLYTLVLPPLAPYRIFPCFGLAHVIECQSTPIPLRYLAGGLSYNHVSPSSPLYRIFPYFGKRKVF